MRCDDLSKVTRRGAPGGGIRRAAMEIQPVAWFQLNALELVECKDLGRGLRARRSAGISVSNHFPTRVSRYGDQMPRLIVQLRDPIKYATPEEAAFLHLAVRIPRGKWPFEFVPYHHPTCPKLSARVPDQNRAMKFAVTI